jgi:hypothetical protein
VPIQAELVKGEWKYFGKNAREIAVFCPIGKVIHIPAGWHKIAEEPSIYEPLSTKKAEDLGFTIS